jgi:peptidoglycan/xylan/chitin deacetylase (PgdA/CDA1 family)
VPGARSHPSALVLTFDNLGEASELERGTWPADAPPGSHPSVTVALPRLLDELDAHELTATFFVEAINCELNPEAVREIAARGHELGMHGWRHETWAELSDGRERETLARGMQAFAALGVEVTGFRPPGGDLTPRSASVLLEAGVRWCSPAGGEPGVRDGLAYVPFQWPFVDAYHLMADFAELRVGRGDGAEPLESAVLTQRLTAALHALAVDGGEQTLILHPFLMLDPSWWEGTRHVFGRLRQLAGAGSLRVLPGGDFADSLRAIDAE